MSPEHAPVALITGASSGIGHGIALELAQRGYDLIVVARRAPLLEDLATEVESRWKRQVECMPADLRVESDLERVAARAAEGLDVLVANAGHSTRGAFAKLPLENELSAIRLNVISTVVLCHAAAPAMLTRKRGRILITSSTASFQPLPAVATYAATKAFLTSFAQSLDGEMRPFGVTVTCLAPGYVRRPGRPAPGPRWLWMNSDAVAREAVEGMLRGKPLIVPGIPWKVTAMLAPRVPRSLARMAARAVGQRMARARVDAR